MLPAILLLSILSPTTLAHSHAAIASISKQLAFPDFKGSRVHDLKTLGSAGISEELGIIQIPAARVQAAGRALYWSPVRMLDPETATPASFDTAFTFAVHASPAPATGPRLSSGLAFVIVPDEVTVGRAGAWLGTMNDACDERSRPFAVEFDTFKDDEFMDPNDNHVGINLGSIISHRTTDAAVAGVSLAGGSPLTAWISYDSSINSIDVRLAEAASGKPDLPLLSSHADLSSLFKEYMFVGFSATGDGAQLHNIMSWNFSSQAKAKLRFPVQDRTCQKRLEVHKQSRASRRQSSAGFIIFMSVSLLNLLCIFGYNKWKRRDPSLRRSAHRPFNHKPRRFSFEELSQATKSFSHGEALGSAERGSAFFRGVLPDGSQLAIKRFSHEYLKSCPSLRKLVKQIAAIATLQHPNLVPLRGWCYEHGELLLAYEYMPNESIDDWLYCKWVLPWPRRYKLLREVANALAYLHDNAAKKSVIHQDVKTSNVFLDVTFRARLGDFGLIGKSSAGNSNMAKLSLRCLKGYEGQSGRKGSAEMDVYCFGVMVLEVVGGRKGVEEEVGEEARDLVAWAWRLKEEGSLLDIVDKRLGGRYSQEQATSLLHVGLMCTRLDSQARPSMNIVAKYLSQKPSTHGEEDNIQDPLLQN